MLERQLGGSSGVAYVAASRVVTVLGTLRTGVAWSTAKVPVALAVVDAGGAQSHAADLRATLTASDNGAANRLFASLGAPSQAAAQTTAVLRSAGDKDTRVPDHALGNGVTIFGQTDWSLARQAGFMSRLACLPGGAQVLPYMGEVVPSQRWGLGTVDDAARFKGGWGPGTRPGVPGDYLDRQMGLVTVHDRVVAAAIATAPADGSHTTGVRNLTRIAAWLAGHVGEGAASAAALCQAAS